MIGKTSIISFLAQFCCLAAALSCTRMEPASTALTLQLDCGTPVTKALSDPEEYKLTDANIFIFNCNSLPERHLWVKFSGEDNTVAVEGIVGETYTVYVFCNAGYRMSDMTEGQLLDFKYYLSRPDAYSQGIPMAGMTKLTVGDGNAKVKIGLERLMSKVSLRIDRSRLNKDVEFFVHKVKIGNCPRCAVPFAPAPLSSGDDTFAAGFCKYGDECSALNTDRGGLSENVSLFLLENPAAAPDMETCPYVELQIDYVSDECYSTGSEGLVYRFHIRENDSYNVERNCHYRVCVTPNGSGLLTEDSWRVDKSGLVEVESEYGMKILPEGSVIDGQFYPFYYRMAKNSSMHFDLVTVPRDVNVRLREDLVEDELAEGRAEYVMDVGGRGFTVNSLEMNCMSMMEIIPDEPLGEAFAETIVIEISD